MPEQFLNPAPDISIQKYLFFDFPCDGKANSVGVGRPATAAGQGAYCAYDTTYAPHGNVNLNPAMEQLYGRLGNPARDQGHPFMKEMRPEEEDPDANGRVVHDQIVDLDNGIQIDHTGRLSGNFVPFIASKPFFSTVTVSALAVAPVGAHTRSVRLAHLTNWLEPAAEAPNRWFWRIDQRTGRRTNELLYTAHVLLRDPRKAQLQGEAVYKLVYQWKFWRYLGNAPYADAAPNLEKMDRREYERLGISGFDEAMAFEVTGGTADL